MRDSACHCPDFHEALHDGWWSALAKQAHVIEEVLFAAFRSEWGPKGELVILQLEIDASSGRRVVIVSPLAEERCLGAIGSY